MEIVEGAMDIVNHLPGAGLQDHPSEVLDIALMEISIVFEQEAQMDTGADLWSPILVGILQGSTG